MRKTSLYLGLAMVLAFVGAAFFTKAQPYVPSVNAILGTTGNPAPLLFTCPNDGTTGTGTGLVTKLSAANTCISIATADVQATVSGTSFIGICVSGCGTAGNSQIAPFGAIVPCVFDNATTFGHSAAPSTVTAGNCRDTASGFVGVTGPWYLGIVLDTGSAGTHNIVLNAQRNPGSWNNLINSSSKLTMNLFTGSYLMQTAAGGGGISIGFGGTASTNPCLTDSGALLKLSNGNGNATCSGDGNLGVGHLASDAAAPPTFSSGGGTTPSPSVVSGGDYAFQVNVGGGGVATSVVFQMGTNFTAAPICFAQDVTTNIATRCSITLGPPTTATLTAASAWTAQDKVNVQVIGQGGL